MGVVHTHSASLALVALLAGCGGGNKTIATVPVNGDGSGGGLAGGSGDTDCKSKSDCKPTTSDISASFAPSGALLGFIGEPVDWEFHGVDRDTANPDQLSSVRKVMVLLDKVPEGSTIDPAPGKSDLTTVVKVNWTPTKEQAGSLDIILRDYERCIVNESKDRCNKYVFIEAYDTKFTDVQWQVADRQKVQDALAASDPSVAANSNVVNVADPNCGPAPTTSADITNKVVTSLMGFIVSPAVGIMTMAPSLLGGLTGGSSTPAKPTQC